jgi:uncharacterized membrane protein HdeD (DUF308 family)
MSLIPYLNPGIKPWLQRNIWLLPVTLGIGFAIGVAVLGNMSLSRHVPQNYFLLLCLTICLNYLFVIGTALWTEATVTLAFFLFCGILSNTILAFTSNQELKEHRWQRLASVSLAGLFAAFVIVEIFVSEATILTNIVCFLIAAGVVSIVYLETTIIVDGENH